MQHTERLNISIRQVNPWLQTNKETCTVTAISCNQWWWTIASRKWKLQQDSLHAWGRYRGEKKKPTSVHIETWNLSGICIWIYISASQQNSSSLSLDKTGVPSMYTAAFFFPFFFLRGRTAWEKKKIYKKVHPNQPAISDVKQINARKPPCHMSNRHEMSTISCRRMIRR